MGSDANELLSALCKTHVDTSQCGFQRVILGSAAACMLRYRRLVLLSTDGMIWRVCTTNLLYNFVAIRLFERTLN